MNSGTNDFGLEKDLAALWHRAVEKQLDEKSINRRGVSPNNNRNWVSNVKSQKHIQNMCYTHHLHLQSLYFKEKNAYHKHTFKCGKPGISANNLTPTPDCRTETYLFYCYWTFLFYRFSFSSVCLLI